MRFAILPMNKNELNDDKIKSSSAQMSQAMANLKNYTGVKIILNRLHCC